MFAVMLGLVMVVASSVSTIGSFYPLPSPVLAAGEGGSSGGGGSDNSGSGDNSNGGSNDNRGSVKDEGKTENENTPPPNEGSGDKTTPAATSEQPGATSKLPKCDGSFQDCVTTNGDVCKAGQGGHECECADDMSDCPKHPSLQKTSAAGGPDTTASSIQNYQSVNQIMASVPMGSSRMKTVTAFLNMINALKVIIVMKTMKQVDVFLTQHLVNLVS